LIDHGRIENIAGTGAASEWWLFRFWVHTVLPGARHNGVCLLHWHALQLETEEPE